MTSGGGWFKHLKELIEDIQLRLRLFVYFRKVKKSEKSIDG